MAVTKNFLDSQGAQYLVSKILDLLKEKMSEDEMKAFFAEALASEDTAGTVKIGDGLAINGEGKLFVEPIPFGELIEKPTTLAGYGIADAASLEAVADLENEIDSVKESVSKAYHFKGSVAAEADLANIQNPGEGDVYNITETGQNAAWVAPADGKEGFWDLLGGPLEVETITKAEINAMFMKYVPLEVGSAAELKELFNTPGDKINVKLTQDISLNEYLFVPEGKSANINLGNNSLLMGNKAIVANGSDLHIEGEGELKGSNYIIQATNNASVTIDGGHLISTNDCATYVERGAEITVNDGQITAQEVAVLAQYGGIATINGGMLEGIDNFAIGGNGTAGRGETVININGGTIVGNITSNGYVACAIYHPQDGILNISGGEIIANGGCGVLMRAGQLNMTGGDIIVNATEARPAGSVGKVGDSSVTVGLIGVIYDKSANYPDNQNLEVNIADGNITGVDGSIQVLSDEVNPNVHITGGEFDPPYAG